MTDIYTSPEVWRVVGQTAVTVLAVALKYYSDARPKVIAYLSHATTYVFPDRLIVKTSWRLPVPVSTDNAAVQTLPPETPQEETRVTHVNAHSLVVRNIGNKSASNVRIGHLRSVISCVLSDGKSYEFKRGVDQSWEIVLVKLVPNEQVQISYLYTVDTTWGQIFGYVKDDDGLAIAFQALPEPPISNLRRWTGYVLWAFGVYFLAQIAFGLLPFIAVLVR